MAKAPATAAQRTIETGSGIVAVVTPGVAVAVVVVPWFEVVFEVTVELVVEPVEEARSSCAMWIFGSVGVKTGVPRALSTLSVKSSSPPLEIDFRPLPKNERPSCCVPVPGVPGGGFKKIATLPRSELIPVELASG